MRTFTIISLVVLSIGLGACKKKKPTPAAVTTPPPVETEGYGRGVIYYGTDSIISQGVCGATNSLGYYVISIQDGTHPARNMSIALNTATLPTVTTTYNLVASQDADNEAILDFIDITGGAITGWSSDDNSGTITLVVDGNKVTCNFNGIPVPYYQMYNDPPYDVNGIAKGSFTFYK